MKVNAATQGLLSFFPLAMLPTRDRTVGIAADTIQHSEWSTALRDPSTKNSPGLDYRGSSATAAATG